MNITISRNVYNLSYKRRNKLNNVQYEYGILRRLRIQELDLIEIEFIEQEEAISTFDYL